MYDHHYLMRNQSIVSSSSNEFTKWRNGARYKNKKPKPQLPKSIKFISFPYPECEYIRYILKQTRIPHAEETVTEADWMQKHPNGKD